jgi:hypothetical protein
MAAADAMVAEKISFTDGSVMDVMRNEQMTDGDWAETKRYLEQNPEEAKAMEEYNSNPQKLRKELLMRCISEAWQKQIDEGDDEFSKKIKSIEEDPDFEALFADIKSYNTEATSVYYDDPNLMMKVSKKMGGVPREAKIQLDKIRKTPMTLQEACKFGDITQVQKYLAETEKDKSLRDVDAKDQKGITCLGYAIGANRLAIVKLLLENQADPTKVDSAGNSGLHYAASYGRKDMVDFLVGKGVDMNQSNTKGMTPLQCATKNKQAGTIDLLKTKGAK